MSNYRRSRVFSHALLSAVEQGLFDKDNLINDLVGWMSEADVEEFVRKNDLLELVGLPDEESDPMDDFNYVGNRSHY
jgi:hypothetical protein